MALSICTLSMMVIVVGATKCIPDAIATSERKDVVEGRPIQMLRYSWELSGITGYVAKYIIEDVFGYRTILAGVLNGSWQGARAVSGSNSACTLGENGDYASCDVNNPSGHYVFDAWRSGDKEFFLMPLEKRPTMLPMGYDGYEGTFLPGDVVSIGRLGTCPRALEYYFHLNSSILNASDFFTQMSVAETMIQMNSFVKAPCTPEAIPQGHLGCKFYEEYTNDIGMYTWRDGACTLNCDNDWILSPACRIDPGACVAWVTTGDGWGVEEVLQQATIWNFALAVVVLPDWGSYSTLAKLLPTMLYWYAPSLAFHSSTPASRLIFPPTDRNEWNERFFKTAPPTINVRKFLWRKLAFSAPKVAAFLENVQFTNADATWMMDKMLLPGATLEGVACQWVLSNTAIWQSWAVAVARDCVSGYGMATKKIDDGGVFVSDRSTATVCDSCPPGMFSTLVLDDDGATYVCKPCDPGRFSVASSSVACNQCGQGEYSDVPASTKCQRCDAWASLSDVNEGQTGCAIQWGFVMLLACPLLLLPFVIFKVRQKMQTYIIEDRPDRARTFSGSWVHGWIGTEMQTNLVEGMCVTTEEFIQKLTSRSTKVITTTQGGRTLVNTFRLFRRRNFIVNASPFRVAIKSAQGKVILNPSRFSSVGKISRGWMSIELTDYENHSSFMPEVSLGQFVIELDKEDWEASRTFPGNNHLVSLYENRIVRHAILVESAEDLKGEIKITRRWHKFNRENGEMLLITWSPPTRLRGMLIHDFLDFLDKAIECKTGYAAAALKRAFSRSNSNAKTRHGVHATSANMYDANISIIEEQATSFDSSYAEIWSQFGPADTFISHVWAECASTTKEAMLNLWDHVQGVGNASTRLAQLSLRVWFCVCCNNQARINEELGIDVQHSSFAQVLRSPACVRVALVSPLKSLERKWCNYEFCLAAFEGGKEPLMITAEGVIQGGQVSPKSLEDLSEKVHAFHCRNAKCTSQADEVLIDTAIELAGGYEALDSKLKHIFHVAISHAHQVTSSALQRFSRPLSEDLTELSIEERTNLSIEETTIATI